MIKLNIEELKQILKEFEKNKDLITHKITYVNGDILEVFKTDERRNLKR